MFNKLMAHVLRQVVGNLFLK